MSKPQEQEFAALITISIPDGSERLQATVVLHAADTIPDGQGGFKRLKDLTLAELQVFADGLESDIWQTYRQIRLEELIEADTLRVELAFPVGKREKLPHAEELLEHAVVEKLAASDAARESGAAIETADTDIAGEKLPAAAVGDSDMVSEASPGSAEGEEQLLTPGREEEIGGSGDEEPQIKVADSEPVFEEKEAGIREPAAADDETAEATGVDEPKVRKVTGQRLQPERPVGTRARVRILGRRRPLGHPTWTAVDVLMNEPAFRDAQAHALSSMDREVAGMLIGPQPEKQPDGRYVVHVSDIIIAKHTRMHGASVTYTPESWRYVNDKLAERYPDGEAVIVGWYHTHPGFGIFLSGMDLFIHQNIFTQIWHIALVLDPVARRSGFFCWDRPQTKVNAYEFPWPTWAPGSW